MMKRVTHRQAAAYFKRISRDLDPMRLFYAIEFPDAVRQRLASISRELAALSSQGRWSKPDNIHLTLQFLGECPTEWLPVLQDILQEAATRCRPFDLMVQGSGTFGAARDILWLGVRPEPALNRLAEMLGELLREQEMPWEHRPFSAHITLARQVKIDPLVLQNWSFPPFSLKVGQISLMESTRQEGSLIYRPLARAQLSPDMR
jgi:RNA 2',3'-cyclic 3'-phosphodiesterase